MTVVLNTNDGGPAKRDIIEMAFEDCGSAGYEFGRTPEEVASALRKLNVLMAEWSEAGININYNQPDYGAGDPEEGSGIPLSAMGAVAGFLALRIAPQMGVALPPEQRTALGMSYNRLLSSTYQMGAMPFRRNEPRGAGAWDNIWRPLTGDVE